MKDRTAAPMLNACDTILGEHGTVICHLGARTQLRRHDCFPPIANTQPAHLRPRSNDLLVFYFEKAYHILKLAALKLPKSDSQNETSRHSGRRESTPE